MDMLPISLALALLAFLSPCADSFLAGSTRTAFGPRSLARIESSSVSLLSSLSKTQLASSSSSSSDNDNNDDVLDVVICGAGPAGLLLSSALAQEGLTVGVVDPTLDKKWPNNYGVWCDEADYFGYLDCCDYIWKQAGVVFDEDTPELRLERPYGRVDRIKLKARLLQELHDYSQDRPYVTKVAKAVRVDHYDEDEDTQQPSSYRPSVVTIRNKDGTEQELKAHLVVDATGFSRAFCQHKDGEVFDPGYQVTYGALFRVKELGQHFDRDRLLLMDYSERHLHDNATLTQSNDRFPSFVYGMPLADDLLFLEETILVSRPAGNSFDLQARLYKRMEALGIEPLQVLEDERAAIPMGGLDPLVPQRTLGFGATSSLVHPASGYMVARAMELAPRVAASVAEPLKELRKQLSEGNAAEISPTVLDDIAKAGWDAVWPTDERRQRDFMHFGFELLCELRPQELRDFFTGFFRLPHGLWEHFLSWRLSGVGHIYMGLLVWAQCIPKRFMVPMVWKSLPFLWNRLVWPFLERGNFAPIDFTSLYFDAARTKTYETWEPEQYYTYLKQLSDRIEDDDNDDSETNGDDTANLQEGVASARSDSKEMEENKVEKEQEQQLTS